MDRIAERISVLVSEGYTFRTSEYISRGFQYYKDNLIPISAAVGISVVLPMLFALIGLTSIGSLLSAFVITPLLIGGLALFLRKAKREEERSFQDFIDATEHMVQLIVYYLIYILILVLVFIPSIIFISSSGSLDWIIAAVSDPQSMTGYVPDISGIAVLVFFLNLIPLLYLAVSYWWAPYLIVYHKIQAWPAMEMSRKVVTKKWFGHFGLAMLMVLIALGLGLASSLFGFSSLLYSVISIAVSIVINGIFYSALFASYDDVVGVDLGEAEQDVIDHLIS